MNKIYNITKLMKEKEIKNVIIKYLKYFQKKKQKIVYKYYQ